MEHLAWNAAPLEGWPSAGAAAFLVLTGTAAAGVALVRVRSIHPAEALRAE